MLSLKKKNVVEQQNEEVKDIPISYNNNIMTDDENSDDEETHINSKTPQKTVKNRLLTTISSDSAVAPQKDYQDDSDRTCCSLLEIVDKVSNKTVTEVYQGTPSLFSEYGKSNFNDEFINNRFNYPLNNNNNESLETNQCS